MSSNKLNPTDVRYDISEKNVGDIVGIEKFAYELKGRKLHLITYHKATEKVRIKEQFCNNGINRRIEKINKYDFSNEYKKVEDLKEPDALSRLYEIDKKQSD